MVVFHRPPATTFGWTTFPTAGYCNSEIQDGVQDGRHILKSPYYHRLKTNTRPRYSSLLLQCYMQSSSQLTYGTVQETIDDIIFM